QQARPDVRVGELLPRQDGDRHRDQDQQAAHGRSAALGEVALRAVGADRLALALGRSQPADEPRAEHQADDERRRARRARTEADVADEVEDAGEAEPLGDHVEHAGSFTTCSTNLASPIELEALTSTASPGRSRCTSASVASSTVAARSTWISPPTALARSAISSPIRISRSTRAA